jgi:pyrimidine-nucleoside phosphorylase
VKESVACLDAGRADLPVSQAARQHGPADLRELVIDSAAHLLVQTKKSKSLAAARSQAETCLSSGAPRKKWDEMIVAQGADLKAFNKKLSLDFTANVVADVKSEKAGYVSKCDARIIGEVIRDIGGGRPTKESSINFDVGVDRIAKPGERVEKSGVLCRLHATDAVQAKSAAIILQTAFQISAKRLPVPELVCAVIG